MRSIRWLVLVGLLSFLQVACFSGGAPEVSSPPLSNAQQQNVHPDPVTLGARPASTPPVTKGVSSPKNVTPNIGRKVGFLTTCNATLKPGQSVRQTLSVRIPSVPAKADIMFVLDLTGSMGGELSNAKRNSINIMNRVASLIKDVRFGVASHMDYPGRFNSCGYNSNYGSSGRDYPYRLDRSITSNRSSVSSGINGLRLGSGSDGPESYSRIMWEMAHDSRIGWRSGSKRFAIQWGDNIPHDCSLRTGKSPGRDGRVNTSDDIVWTSALDDLKRKNIAMLSLYSGGNNSWFNSWNTWAKRTGGKAYKINSNGTIPGGQDIATFIVNIIKANVATINRLTVGICPGSPYGSWLSSPSSYSNVKSGTGPYNLGITIRPPAGTRTGTYSVPLCAFGDGAEYTRVNCTIKVFNEVPPVVTVSPSGTTKTVNEGSSTSFSVTASDRDSSISSFTVSGVPSFCTASKSGNRYNVTCRPGYTHGTRDYRLTFRATDSDSSRKSTSLTVTVRVNNINRTPSISDPGRKSVNEGQTLTFSVTGSDPDGDSLSWSSSSMPSGARFSGSGSRATFTWTPGYTQSGVYTVRLIVTDSGSPRRSFTRSVVITVNNVNRRPVITNPGNKSVLETKNLSFSVSASDPDGNSLTWSISGTPSGARFSGSGTRGSFSWTPSFTQAGTYRVTFTVTDNGSPRLSASTSITITVIDTNRAPVWSGTTSYTVNENQSLGAKTLTASDPDGDKMTYSVGSVPSGFSASVSGNGTSRFTVTFNWKPTFSQAGTYRITFTAKDSQGATSNRTVTITVRNVNRAPVLSNPGSKSVVEGKTLTFSISGSDPDGNSFAWYNSALPSGAKITGSGNSRTFTWTPGYTQAGRYTVTFTIKDNGSPSLSASRTVAITVGNTNRAPALTNPGSKTIAENSKLTFSISGSDPDGNALTWKVTGLPTGATATGTGNSRTFNWTPGFEQAGSYTVTFVVTDNGTPALSATRSVRITVTNVNRPPRFTSKPPPTAIEDKLYTYRATATDPDLKTTLTFSKISGPNGSAVTSAGVVTWTPKDADAEKTFGFEIRVCDQLKSCVNQKWTVKVINVNDPPKITSKAVTGATEGKFYVYNPTFVDPDPRDSHTWTLVKGPEEMNIDPKTGRVFWTPRSSAAGKTYDVEIRICDAAGACDTQKYKVTVGNVNNPPKIISTAPTVAIEGKLYAYNPIVFDADSGDTHTWKLLKMAPRMTINSKGQIRWNPTNADVSKVYDVEIQVCDKANTCDKQAWKLSTRNTNSAPKITSTPSGNATENQLYTYSPTFVDPDRGDTHVWTLKKGPTGAKQNKASGLVTWTPSDEYSGYTVTFQIEICDNAGACDTQTWTVKVKNANDAPRITTTPPTRVNEKKGYIYEAIAVDPDPGDSLTWTLIRGPRGTAISTQGKVTWQPGIQDAGKTYDFEIRVCDKAKICDSQSWRVQVSNSNDAPSITSTPPSTATENNTYSYSPTASDPDPSEVLSWKLVKGPKGAQVDTKTGKLTWKPTDQDAGKDVDFTIEVCDSAGACDTQTWKVKVTNVNDAPTITSTPNTVATEGRLYGYSPTFEDKDANDTHTWRLLKSPKGAKVNARTGEIEWTPGAADAGKSFDFELEICDNDRDCDTQKWTVKVLNTNGAPTITSKPGTSVAEGGTYSYKPTFTDSDPGDTHTWRGLDLPPGATINSKTGEIGWKTGTKEAGKTYTFEIEVCDKIGKCDTQKWTVTVGNSNDAPTIKGEAPTIAYVGQKLQFGFKVEDNDPGDTHTWGFVKTHAGVTIDRKTGKVTWTPASADAGKTYDFEIQVCDNGKPILCAQVKFKIKVLQSCLTDSNCSAGQICQDRLCTETECSDKKPCKNGEFCIGGKCKQDPCKTIQCATDEICRPTDGKCIQPCAGVTCSNGQECRDGKCVADPCASTPCKKGEICDAKTDPSNPTCVKNPCDSSTCKNGRVCDQDGNCVDDPCKRMKCPSEAQQCVAGQCIDRQGCKVDSDCPSAQTCVDGRCFPTGCYDKANACAKGEVCLKGKCVKSPCDNKTCASGEYCRSTDGKCVKACANVQCPSGSKCVDGKCEVDTCASVRCAAGEVCVKGKCETDKCSSNSACKAGRICNPETNRCEDDPCFGVKCPDSKQVCKYGQCQSPPNCILDKDCPSGKLCINNDCKTATCRKDGDCQSDELCLNGQCKVDSCKTTTCDKGKFCRAGKCIDSCAGIYCARGEVCVDGRCTGDVCANIKCNNGETCVNGTCVKDKCGTFACRDGRVCKGDRCVADACAGVKCPDGQKCEDGQCKGTLTCKTDRDCPDSGVCVNGECQASACYRVTCADGSYCKDGKCVNDFCSNRNCGVNEFCRPTDGKCIKACPTCASGEICRDGQCVQDPCADVGCQEGEICKAGKCVKDACSDDGKGKQCKFRRSCVDGKCVDDPCDNVKCADGQTCRDGVCYGKLQEDERTAGENVADAGPIDDIPQGDGNSGQTDKGSGSKGDKSTTTPDTEVPPVGCDCQTASEQPLPWLSVLMLFFLISLRRRRK